MAVTKIVMVKRFVTKLFKIPGSNLVFISLDNTDENIVNNYSCVFHEENEEDEDRRIKVIEIENGESDV